MKELEELKAVMGDLQRRRAALNEQAQEFQTLQNEITELRQRARYDQDAAKKIRRLDDTMKNGGASMTEKIFERVGKTEQCLQKVSDEFKTLAADVPQPLEVKPQRQAVSMKRPNRAFA